MSHLLRPIWPLHQNLEQTPCCWCTTAESFLGHEADQYQGKTGNISVVSDTAGQDGWRNDLATPTWTPPDQYDLWSCKVKRIWKPISGLHENIWLKFEEHHVTHSKGSLRVVLINLFFHTGLSSTKNAAWLSWWSPDDLATRQTTLAPAQHQYSSKTEVLWGVAIQRFEWWLTHSWMITFVPKICKWKPTAPFRWTSIDETAQAKFPSSDLGAQFVHRTVSGSWNSSEVSHQPNQITPSKTSL